MTIELYNELLGDFKKFYDFTKEHVDSTEIANKKIIELVQKGDLEKLATMENPYMWFVDYIRMSSELIDKLDSLDPKFTAKFHERQSSDDVDERSKKPEIYILFNKLAVALDKENYDEADRLKNKIFRKY